MIKNKNRRPGAANHKSGAIVSVEFRSTLELATMGYRFPRNLTIRYREFCLTVCSLILLFVCTSQSTAQTAPTIAKEKHPTAGRPQTTTFIVVRHAEREGDKDQLSSDGKKRAEVLRDLGTILNVTTAYSTNTQRTKNTAKPLVEALGLKLEPYGRVSQPWVEQLKLRHAGKVVLIVGHSNTSGVIAGLLASAKPFPIAHDEYDSAFIVTINKSSANCVRLKYGRSSKGAPSAAADKMGPINLPSHSK